MQPLEILRLLKELRTLLRETRALVREFLFEGGIRIDTPAVLAAAEPDGRLAVSTSIELNGDVTIKVDPAILNDEHLRVHTEEVMQRLALLVQLRSWSQRAVAWSQRMRWYIGGAAFLASLLNLGLDASRHRVSWRDSVPLLLSFVLTVVAPWVAQRVMLYLMKREITKQLG